MRLLKVHGRGTGSGTGRVDYAAGAGSLESMFDHMFHIPLPLLEKIIRPALVYLSLILLLRAFGKRELAQLNPFDLVVLLTLSNTVQNAIIGEDNSLSGGLLGAVSLLTMNWMVNRTLFWLPKVRSFILGQRTVLIEDGEIDQTAMKREIMTQDELMGVLHRNGVHSPEDLKLCSLEPSGNFYLNKKEDATPTAHFEALMKKMEELSAEIAALKAAR